MNKKVSFDFDSTLDRQDVQSFAKELIENNIDVWVHTSRYDYSEIIYLSNWNDDLYSVIENLGIPKSNVVFTQMIDKYKFLKDKDFIWHLDDDNIEVNLINRYTNVKGICVYDNKNWKSDCSELLK